MNTRQMEYFVAIAEERQVTAAAARLHISQPPLSRELARMERELGVRLVVRGPRSVELTEAGKLLYRRCREVLELTGAMEREVESFGSGGSGVVAGAGQLLGGVRAVRRHGPLRGRLPQRAL